jgi:hypothetical protein
LDFVQFSVGLWYILSLNFEGLVRLSFLVKRVSVPSINRSPSSKIAGIPRTHSSDESSSKRPGIEQRQTASMRPTTADGSSPSGRAGSNLINTAAGSPSGRETAHRPSSKSDRPTSSSQSKRKNDLLETENADDANKLKNSSAADTISCKASANVCYSFSYCDIVSCDILDSQIKELFQLLHKCPIESDPALDHIMKSFRREYIGNITAAEYLSWVDRNRYAVEPLVLLQQHLRRYIIGEIQWVSLMELRYKTQFMLSPDFFASLKHNVWSTCKNHASQQPPSVLQRVASFSSSSKRSNKVLPADASSTSDNTGLADLAGHGISEGGVGAGSSNSSSNAVAEQSMKKKNELAVTTTAGDIRHPSQHAPLIRHPSQHPLLSKHHDGELEPIHSVSFKVSAKYADTTNTIRKLRSESAVLKTLGVRTTKPKFLRTNSWSQQRRRAISAGDPTHRSRMFFKDWIIIYRIDACFWLLYR